MSHRDGVRPHSLAQAGLNLQPAIRHRWSYSAGSAAAFAFLSFLSPPFQWPGEPDL